MAESMKGLHRTHRCAETVNAAIGSEVTVMGWVSKSRNKGGIVFTDLRDRSGILQIIFEEDTIGSEGFEKAGRLRSIRNRCNWYCSTVLVLKILTWQQVRSKL